MTSLPTNLIISNTLREHIHWPTDAFDVFTAEKLADPTLRCTNWGNEISSRMVWSIMHATSKMQLRSYFIQIATAINGPLSADAKLAPFFQEWQKYSEIQCANLPESKTHEADSASCAPEYDHKDRRVVILTPDEFDVTEETAKSFAEYINKHPGTYAFGSKLSRIVGDNIRIVSEDSLRGFITQSCHLRQYKEKKGELIAVQSHPPVWLVNALDAREMWDGIPPLRGIMHYPVLLPSGEILQKHGYDPKSGLYLSSKSPTIRIPDHPTQTDAQSSAMWILQQICSDFPFGEKLDVSGVLAALLTPFARPAIDGPCPAFLFEASTPGSGKSLLAQAIGHVVIGKNVPETPSVGTDDAEWRKTITASLKGGEPLSIIDNIRGAFGSQCLDLLLTCVEWDARILGVSERWCGPALKVWFLTSNNMTIIGDLPRRIIPIRINCADEHPERRGGWKHHNLLSFIDKNRPVLIQHVMTILRAWACTGMPVMGGEFFGKYESWCQVVRDAVMFSGWPDPCPGRATLYINNNQDLVTHGELLNAWLKTQQDVKELASHCGFNGYKELKNLITRSCRGQEGITAAEMLILAEHTQIDGTMRQALINLSTNGKLPTAQTLGTHLGSLRDRPVNGLRFSFKQLNGNNIWTVLSSGK